ncbi:hypothetical protein [Bartonella choladocola]|uniref:hypothetical protein n=1 Tax=Bartonella choladocola TaxID=2750995 RepID=UPI001AEEC077|nr:hypothetical protein [Bartonella choladocola]MBI0014839.1 hypothetical protein [Bartonella sp. B10834G3]
MDNTNFTPSVTIAINGRLMMQMQIDDADIAHWGVRSEAACLLPKQRSSLRTLFM